MLNLIIKVLTFDLTDTELKFLRDFLWRAVVTFHMVYACGYLALLGVPLQGFAQASEVAKYKEAVVLQARLGIVREIRLQTTAMCRSSDMEVRNALINTIDKLREDYRAITGEIYPEARCQP
jgi:hypothetical protein